MSRREAKKAMEESVYPEQGVAFAESSLRKRKNVASRRGAYLFGVTAFVCFALIAFFVCVQFTSETAAAVIALVVGILATLCIHICQQWERAIVLRLGRFNRVAGPGFFLTIPILEYSTMRVDLRMRCTFFTGEQILTADLVPVDVDAVFYWTIWDPKKACVEVEDYVESVSRIAQACLRDVIGSVEIDELSTRRRQLDEEIRDEVAAVTEEWGISVTTVKIRNIVIPKDLQDAMSKAAQAQREKDARMILGEVEKDLASMLVDAANVYDTNEHALQLRAMHGVNDNLREKGGRVVLPSSGGDSVGSTADFLTRL